MELTKVVRKNKTITKHPQEQKRLFDITKIFECDICSLLEFSSQKMMQFYTNNNGNQGHNINHQEVTNEMTLFIKLIEAKDQMIEYLQQQLQETK